MLQCSASLLDYPEWKRRQEYQKILRNICNGSSSTLSNGQCENTLRHPRATVNFKILLDIRVRQSIRKYSWTPAGLSHWNIGTRQTCMIWLLFIIRHVNSINHVNSVNHTPGPPQLENTPGPLVRQSIRKYSWTPACNSQLENTLGHPRATVN